jgi:hypothetical protein
LEFGYFDDFIYGLFEGTWLVLKTKTYKRCGQGLGVQIYGSRLTHETALQPHQYIVRQKKEITWSDIMNATEKGSLWKHITRLFTKSHIQLSKKLLTSLVSGQSIDVLHLYFNDYSSLVL